MADKTPLTSYSYIAGLFDGEGCINIYQSKSSLYMRVDIVNTNRECLEFTQSYFGGKLYTRPRPGRTQYDLVLSGADAKDMLEVMLPYLIVKRPQAELAIAFQSLVKGRGEIKCVSQFRLEARETIADVIKLLNNGGKINAK